MGCLTTEVINPCSGYDPVSGFMRNRETRGKPSRPNWCDVKAERGTAYIPSALHSDVVLQYTIFRSVSSSLNSGGKEGEEEEGAKRGVEG